MTPSAQELSKLAGRLKDFLREANWYEMRQARGVDFYAPPESLGFQGKFSVAIPSDLTSPGSAKLLHSAAGSLVEVYGYASLGDLLNRAASSVSDVSGPAILVSRFVDSSTRRGAMPLGAIVAYTSSVEASLYRSAKFKLGNDSKETKLLSQKFAKECMFLQTEVGSFITKVEVPGTVLKQADLFGGEMLDSTEVCSALFSAINFINQQILASDEVFDSPEILGNSLALFDVELLDSISKVVLGPEMERIDFSMEIGSEIRASTTGYLTSDKKQRLKDFSDFIRDQLRGENNLDVTGSIVELRSRDPEGNRNHILLVTQFHGDRTFVSATLSNEQYQRAVDAHRSKRNVRIKGNGTRLKTQIRVIEITEFLA